MMVINRLLQIPSGVYFLVAVVFSVLLNYLPGAAPVFFQIAIWCFLGSIYCPYNSWFVKTVFSLVGSVQLFNGIWEAIPGGPLWLWVVLQCLLFLWLVFLLVLQYDLPNDRLDNSYFYILRKKEGTFLQFTRALIHPFLSVVIYANGYFYKINSHKVLEKIAREDFSQRSDYRQYHIRRGPPIQDHWVCLLDHQAGKTWSWIQLFRSAS
jgi:hypothetical protein